MSDVAVSAETFSTAPPEAPPSGLGLSGLKRSTSSAVSRRLAPLLRKVSAGEIGGETLDDAWKVVERVSGRGDAFTLGLWDDASYSVSEIVEAAHEAIQRIGAGGGDGYLSIKPPALGFDPTLARELGREAARNKVRLHCDSHGIEVADRTFQFMADLARDLSPELLSVSIPGRWRRSGPDAVRMLGAGIGIRIVKGQWSDPANPEADLRSGFVDVVNALQGGGHIALASHDAPLLRACAQRLDTIAASYEIECIHGLVTPALKVAAAASGRPVRLYVPYGRGFVPGALGVLRRNPRLGLALVRAALPGRG